MTSTSASTLVCLVSVALVVLGSTMTTASPTMTERKTALYLPTSSVKLFPQIYARAYTHIEGAAVSIEFGYQKGMDKLSSTSTSSVIVAKFDVEKGTMFFTGRATTQAYTEAIQSVFFSTTATDGKARQISWNFGKDTIFSADTNHFYQFFARPSLDWTTALKVCEQAEFFGLKGYLATLTTKMEYDDVAPKFNNDMWLGATDVTNEGDWRWTTGPEGLNGTTTPFWSGASAFAGGSAVKGAFEAWARFQPDDVKPSKVDSTATVRAGQHYLALRYISSGTGFYDDGLNDRQAGLLCEFGGLDDAAVTATIKDLQGSITLLPGCADLKVETDCLAQKSLGCSWDGSKCAISSCLVHETEKMCDAQWKCFYNSEASPAICENTDCSAFGDKDLCNADTKCTFNSKSQCVPAKCSDRTTSCACNSMQGKCQWSSGKCINKMFLDCPAEGLDIVFMVDGSSGMNQAFGRHPNGFEATLEVIKDMAKHSPLTGTKVGTPPPANGMRFGIVQYGPAAPVRASENLAGDLDELIATALFHEENFANSPNSLLAPSYNVVKQAFADSASRKKVVIFLTDSPIADTVTLDSTIVHLGFSLRKTESHDAESISAETSLTKLVGAKNVLSIMLRALEHTVSTLCVPGESLAALVLPPTAKTSDCALMAMTECGAAEACAWDNSAKTCVASHCTSYCDSTKCNADTVCQWDATKMCTRVTCTDCTSGKQAAVCEKTTTCQPKRCVHNPSESSCAAEAGCEYDDDLPLKCNLNVCSTLIDAPSCIASAECSWSDVATLGNACFRDICKVGAPNQTMCAKHLQCQYGKFGCESNECGIIRSEQKCDEDYRCEWDVHASPATCAPSSCGKYNFRGTSAMTDCKADKKCYWQPIEENKLKDKCIDRSCDTRKTSSDCLSNTNCVWRDNQCRENRFVQCPAIDLVFLLEGTDAMTKSFGRHPNGYAALIQIVRAWASAAPLSPNVDAPGFRISMISYGPEGVALQPAKTDNKTGTSGLLSSNLRFFLKDLDFFDGQVIGKDVKGDAYIKMGLQAAIDVFASSEKPTIPRKRIVMIMGNSGIADGTKIAADIETLRKGGAVVFSNHVRRFDSLSASDSHSASFLLPLASDPSLSHFLYTTVDNIDSLLLQKFCDPTTGPGKSLQVSRSGDVPCVWMTSVEECNAIPYCNWDATATPTCPSDDQCPNLECLTIPSVMKAANFTCENCKLTNGALSCSKTDKNTPVMGGCRASSCSTAGTCASSCKFDAKRNLCAKSMCNIASAPDCEKEYGCRFNFQTNVCEINECAMERDYTTCMSGKYQGKSAVFDKCSWNTRVPSCNKAPCPALCRTSACNGLSKSACSNLPSICSWDGNNCFVSMCTHDLMDACNADGACVWDDRTVTPAEAPRCVVFSGNCMQEETPVVSACSAKCGPGVTTSVRRILRQGQQGLTQCVDPIQTAPCSAPTACATFCDGFKNGEDCAANDECEFDGKCIMKVKSGCEKKSADQCTGACRMAGSTCTDVGAICQSDSKNLCTAQNDCMWKVPSVDKAILYNPGDEPTSVFSSLHLTGTNDDTTDGATVYIEKNYQRGKDLLYAALVVKEITVQWHEGSGALHFVGTAPISTYSSLLNQVKFYTSSTQQLTRTVSWGLGKEMFYLSTNGHFYQYTKLEAATYSTSREACGGKKKTELGASMLGYLATITTREENNLISTTMEAHGWLGGSDAQAEGVWKWTEGDENGKAFWQGGSNGKVMNGMFNHWEPSTVENPQGEPSNSVGVDPSGEDYLYILPSGYWADKSSEKTASGMVCEFGRLSDTAPKQPIGGSVSVDLVGCFPKFTCSWHQTESACSDDHECTWNVMKGCRQSCRSIGLPTTCDDHPECRWNTELVPARCDNDECIDLGMTACNKKCRWDSVQGKCVYRTGCEKYDQTACAARATTCAWKTTVTPAMCLAKDCSDYSATDCLLYGACQTKSDATGKLVCVQKTCQHSDSTACNADASCNWLEAPDTYVKYPPGGALVVPFTGVPSGLDSKSAFELVDGATIMITEGYDPQSDKLECGPSDCPPSEVSVSYEAPVLYIRVVGDKIYATKMYSFVDKVVFKTSSNSKRARRVSYSLGLRMAYIPAAENSINLAHFVKFVGTSGVTSYETAKNICGSMTYFGAKGAVAKIDEERQQMALRTMKARGVLGAKVSANQDWYWAQNSAATTDVFWKGYGVTGTPPPSKRYAQWDLGQPLAIKDQAGNIAIDKAAVYLMPSGKWVSANFDTLSFGVICRFDAPTLNGGGGERGMQPYGCFARVCPTLLTSRECSMNSLCEWKVDKCVASEKCVNGANPTACESTLNCFWNYDSAACMESPRNICNELDQSSCTTDATFKHRCDWTASPAACQRKACTKYPFASTCTNDPECRWLSKESTCVKRLCGYPSETDCWNNNLCVYVHDQYYQECTKNPCSDLAQAACSTTECKWSDASKTCTYNRCGRHATKEACQIDPACLFAGGVCLRPDCTATNEAACTAQAKCYFDAATKTCRTDQCSMNLDTATCKAESANSCLWDAISTPPKCRKMSQIERNAPQLAGELKCPVTEKNPNIWWLYVLLVAIVIGLVGIMYRLYLAYKHGYSFTDPKRYNKKFSAQEQYASELVDVADERETEGMNNETRPDLDDL